MTHSQRTLSARAVRILACVVTLWAVLLLWFPFEPKNNTPGLVLLVVGPLIMFGARWIDPPISSSASELPAATNGEEASGAAGKEAAREPAGSDPR